MTLEKFGITLNSSEAQSIDRTLVELEELCPFGSHIKLAFQETDAKYFGMLLVKYPKGQFLAESCRDTPLETFKELLTDIHFQLDHWKKSRFERDRIQKMTS